MSLMSIVLYVILGGAAGWIASMIMGTDAEMGALGNIIVGIIGGFLGGFLVQALTGFSTQGLNFTSFVVAVLGAVILLAIVKAIGGRSVHA